MKGFGKTFADVEKVRTALPTKKSRYILIVMDFSCRVEVCQDGLHLIASGQLDDRSGDALYQAIRAVLTGCPDVLVIDLTEVDHVSAEGAAALVDATHSAIAVCVSVVLRTSPAVRQRLAMLGDSDLDGPETGAETRISAPATPGRVRR
ncbi:hypothetical protein Pa4123_46510 [Phytohabitans aurantiacus]|uniref:STAS domain-containing protein n=2 Tax=Phytohabitans aurantiacus TaxID=3016789 RepID=A0ABQ5R1D2_9ACTN|nr:hypothetical protein Pa4123_46510 [Phytohabitans aurantiacus]